MKCIPVAVSKLMDRRVIAERDNKDILVSKHLTALVNEITRFRVWPAELVVC
jgi:hypothetical protein